MYDRGMAAPDSRLKRRAMYDRGILRTLHLPVLGNFYCDAPFLTCGGSLSLK